MIYTGRKIGITTPPHPPWAVFFSPFKLRSICVVPRTAIFWTEMSDVFHGICCSHTSSIGVTTQSAPIITGTIDALTFQAHSSSSFGLVFFSLLLLLLFAQPPLCLVGLSHLGQEYFPLRPWGF